jgi:phosphate:Na+ symporter
MRQMGAAAMGAARFVLGMAVFFLGLAVMRRGVAGTANAGLRRAIARVTRGPLGAAATGLVLTLVLQSSSLTTVLLMELVDAGLIGYGAAVAVVLGGNVGAALSVQFLALRLYDLALPILAIGAVLALVARRRRWRGVGQAVTGFGILYAGIALVSSAVDPFAADPRLGALVLRLGHTPLAAGLFGCLITAVVQSNGIANGILLALARKGLLPLGTAAAVIAGANVGSGTLALIAAIPLTPLARRLAVANALVNVAGLLWVVPGFGLFVRVAGAAARDGAQAMANAHILFNLLASLTLLPVVLPFAAVSAVVADRIFAPARSHPVRLPWPASGPSGRGPARPL